MKAMDFSKRVAELKAELQQQGFSVDGFEEKVQSRADEDYQVIFYDNDEVMAQYYTNNGEVWKFDIEEVEE